MVSLALMLVCGDDFRNTFSYQALGTPTSPKRGLAANNVIWPDGMITGANYRMMQIRIKNHTIKLGINLSQLIEYLGQPNGPDCEEVFEDRIIITYYVEGNYYSFYFLPNRSNLPDHSILAEIDVKSGW
jgi:hypothetical protein